MAITRVDHTNGYVIHYWDDGTKEKHWWVNGQRHRVDGPAIEHANGTTAWFLNDKRHRVDGPAVEDADGGKIWFLHGVDISSDVEQWIIENQFPDYREWTSAQKVMFVLRWG